MKFKMAQNSIFAILLRSPWWISGGITAFLLFTAKVVPNPAIAAILLFGAIPFLVVACISGWKRRNVPSNARVERVTEAVRAMSWKTFSDELARGFHEDGCGVTRVEAGAVDFSLNRHNRAAVVSARRWKASQVGVPPLRDLHAACEARDAHEGIFVTTGEITEQAAEYARNHRIQFLTPPEMARLMRWL